MTMKHRYSYKHFATIDGSHPLRAAVPEGYVDYAARHRHEGSVFYFNFPLAREMGLLAASHPDFLYADIQRALLDTFSLQIINEYDLEQGVDIPVRDILPGRYMATRYLQIQHPGKRGETSGDGRAIWNGHFKGRRGIWDISSCGTGTTALSPAVAHAGHFIQTGDENVSYGNGRACLWDGISAAMMSEIYHHSGIATERTLVVIAYPDGTAINVRATPNLLRPAHFFMYIKQNNRVALEGLIEYYIDRQVKNGHWPRMTSRTMRYRYFLETVTRDFARVAARFESEYIFCWLDWDGDNILMDGGIIDYGSLRQFGLFHHEYRYDDVERMSTTITEQKNKARYIVQTFAQIVEGLLTGEKKNIRSYSQHSSITLFGRTFSRARDEFFFNHMGVTPAVIDVLFKSPSVVTAMRSLRQSYDYFERAKSSKGIYPVSDGISWDAIYCMRDFMREMPGVLLAGKGPMSAPVFIDLLRSRYASDDDVVVTPGLKRRIKKIQKEYQHLVSAIATASGQAVEKLLRDMKKRSAIINRYDRITGDAIIHVADQLVEASHSLNKLQVMHMFNDFVAAQVLSPEFQARKRGRRGTKVALKQHNSKRGYSSQLYLQMIQTVADHREGL
jgi:hypothetical protein